MVSNPNTFEYAPNHNEIDDFFRGKDRYFVRSPDYFGHVHGANISGQVCRFVAESEESGEKFEEAFLAYMAGLDMTGEELSHLLANLSSYFAEKNRGRMAGVNLFSSHDSPAALLLRRYLALLHHAGLYDAVKPELEIHASYIEKLGSDVVFACMREVEEAC
ncbi:hypothetical protein HCH_03764 [Hahella chejuensis KCTC 2396]|uniref:Uncharacterized protein n=1 Tax=Hahella chejuensis (strain KCTC 2396) TaxID=349521 RepID=Q2SFS8_HAHCH|nr:hypothetical protein [Hahella chejuensis]ABC30496.1 hypothetical protein HCH_03764 [Hahella chejuensis KCTC 2396]